MRGLKEFFEACGVRVKIISERGACLKAGELLKGGVSGCVVVCADAALSEQADGIGKSLADSGLVVRRVELKPESRMESLSAFERLPDGVKHYLAVGGGTVCDLVKLAAKNSGDSYSVIPACPSTEGYVTPYAELAEENLWVECAPPEMLIIDYDLLEESPEETLAAGFGRVAEWWIKAFDMKCDCVVDGREMNGVLNALSEEIAGFLNLPSQKEFYGGLLETLLKIGAAASVLPLSPNAVTNFTALNLKGRLQGENGFIVASALQQLYKGYLKSEAADTLLPPDIMKTLKLVEKNCGWEYNKYLSGAPVWDRRESMKRAFVMREYRSDLLAELSKVDLSVSARIWRRLYRDAGYWVKGYVTTAKLMRLISLSSVYGGGLIKYAKQKGFLESYV